MPPAGVSAVTAGRSRSRTASARPAPGRLPVRGIVPAGGAITTPVARPSSGSCDDILEGQATKTAWHVYRRGVDFGKQRIPPCDAQRDHRGIRRALSQCEQMIVRVLEAFKSGSWPSAILTSGSLQRQNPESGVHRDRAPSAYRRNLPYRRTTPGIGDDGDWLEPVSGPFWAGDRSLRSHYHGLL